MSRGRLRRSTPCYEESQLRRSARIQQQRARPLDVPPRCERTTRNAKVATGIMTKGKRKRVEENMNEDKRACRSELTVKKRSLPASFASDMETATEIIEPQSVKRGVRFSDDEPLEALPHDFVAAEEDAARAAAAAVSPKFLASRLENAQYAALGPREMPCPPDAVTRIAPSRTLDSKGRVLLQYPIRYILAYRIEIGDLYDHLKSVKRDFYDFQGTLLAFQIKLDELLNMRHGEGFSEMMYNGKRIWTMIMSQSDRPETLPYPTQRIRKFQEIVGCTSPPLVHAYRPMAHRLNAGAK